MKTIYRSCLILLLLVTALPAQADVEAHRADAAAAVQAGKLKKAAKHYRALLKESPDDGAAHYQFGALLMDMDEAHAAISHFEKARDLGFQPQGAGYRLARIYARGNQHDTALAELESIAAAGFPMAQLIEGETDFAAIANDARFQAALETVRGNRHPCRNTPGARAFDFWIGEWDVYQGGVNVGHNLIEPILGHCTLFENWTSASGFTGKSFNYYDPGYDRWRQIWISDTGTFIEFHGAARDGGIYYNAETRNPQDGQLTAHTLVFTRNADGSVRQHWQQSTDDGTTWTTVWDAQYVRRAEAAKD